MVTANLQRSILALVQILDCLFIACNAAEPWGLVLGHQTTHVFTIILLYLNLTNTLVVEPISMKKAASVCKLEALQPDV